MSPIGLALVAILGLMGYPLYIQQMRRRGTGQRIRAEGPADHRAKAGTPTAGGVILVLSVIAAWLLPGRNPGAAPLVVALGLGGLLGLVDDLQNIRGSRSLGLPAGLKFILQWGLAAVTLVALAAWARPDWQYIPGLGVVTVGWWWIPLGLLALVATANAVNLTDGSDGLAANVTLSALMALLVIGELSRRDSTLLLMPLAVGLGLVVFGFFNAHPARVFMGDTGSMALGFFVAALALEMHFIVLLPLIGLVYVAETLSVIAQVAFFKLTHGRRLLRMSPLHHHLQLSGWSERSISQWLPLANLGGGLVAVLVARGVPVPPG